LLSFTGLVAVPFGEKKLGAAPAFNFLDYLLLLGFHCDRLLLSKRLDLGLSAFELTVRVRTPSNDTKPVERVVREFRSLVSIAANGIGSQGGVNSFSSQFSRVVSALFF
jgi:hypothetical protein